MNTFKTTNGLTFAVNITTKDIRTVREWVKYSDNKPVDIIEAAETGTLAGIYLDVTTLVDVLFVLCLDQIKEHFDLKQFDEENKWNYEIFPNQEKEPMITKASRWFGSIIDGDTLLQMVEAFNEAIINFTPSENQRAAMRTILEKEKEMQRLEAEFRTKTVNLMFERSKEKMVRHWDQHANQEIKKLENQLDGQFNSLTNTPESAE